tara:strand:+ start:50 stop:691 length:642 start_codon:yes stop_codon:yes gene_type:complete
MKKLYKEDYLTLRKGAKVIESDTHGDKVLILADGTYLKLFRVKRLLTSARLSPYSTRFAKNATKLVKLGIPTLNVNAVYRIPAIRRTAVHYYPLTGSTLRNLQNGIDITLADKLGRFFRELHDKGVYFRSLHFGNIVLTPENQLGLIDISDMKLYGKSLSENQRIKNFQHTARYVKDQLLLKSHLNLFIDGYRGSNECSSTHKRMAVLFNGTT